VFSSPNTLPTPSLSFLPVSQHSKLDVNHRSTLLKNSC
jgi:hypothetical protein